MNKYIQFSRSPQIKFHFNAYPWQTGTCVIPKSFLAHMFLCSRLKLQSASPFSDSSKTMKFIHVAQWWAQIGHPKRRNCISEHVQICFNKIRFNNIFSSSYQLVHRQEVFSSKLSAYLELDIAAGCMYIPLQLLKLNYPMNIRQGESNPTQRTSNLWRTDHQSVGYEADLAPEQATYKFVSINIAVLSHILSCPMPQWLSTCSK